jgi:UDP-N-acetyl-2-amino-2-deoxyglucuronate dehydrogenase
MTKRFALIGVAGYIAPRHLQAIKALGHDLVVAMDVSDSVGLMDSYFPEAEFFTEFEAFEAFLEDERLAGRKVDYLSICSPNYLHLPHIKFGLRCGMEVICEKPLVLNEADLDVIKGYETAYGGKVNSILQLRLHPAIQRLRQVVREAPADRIFDVELTYLTSRGKWYLQSWKGLDQKAGGIATNIGVHFFDMLGFIFGPLLEQETHYRDARSAAGFLRFKRARVAWFLSIDAAYLPENAVHGEKSTYRSITVDGGELEFSGGFTDLHTESYQRILAGEGFGVEANRQAIAIVEAEREAPLCAAPAAAHPLLGKVRG